MKQIKKIELVIEPTQSIQIPFNSEILKLGTFNENPCLWVIWDPGQKMMARNILMITDDKEFSAQLNITMYLGSFDSKTEVGHHTIHVFEE